MSTPPPRPDSSAEAQTSTSAPRSSSIPSSNSLLDLLAGAPGRITSPTSTNATTASSSTASHLGQDILSPSRTSSIIPTAASAQSMTTSSSSIAMSTPSQEKQPRDVSHLVQQFMAPSPSLVILSPNAKSAETKDSLQTCSNKEPSRQPPVIHNKALQLPPSPPSSVSSATCKKLRESSSGPHSPITSTPPSRDTELSSSATLEAPSTSNVPPAASPSVKTPFDFVSPFDMLSKRDDDSAPQAAPAPTQPVASSAKQPVERVDGYEAANAGIASLLQKLSASAAANKAAQKPGLTTQLPAAAAASSVPAAPSKPDETHAQSSAEASTSSEKSTASPSSSLTRPAFRKLPSAPAHLDAPEKQYHASRHAVVLKQNDAFDDPKSSGLSVLSPSRSSSAPSIATLDLAAKQSGGLSSLRRTKVETSGIALIPSPFHFPCNVSAAGLLPASRIANLGHDVACYAMSKGKVRLIHVGTGSRLLVQTPTKAAVRSIAAFQSSKAPDTFLLAVLTERSKEVADEGIVCWKVPASFVLQGKEAVDPFLLGRITADPNKSPFAYRFTAIAWHPTEPKLAISTSDSNVMVVDIAQQFLRQTASSSPSKKLRSLSESDVDPRSKDVAHNEPLAGFAFSPDGAMLATVSAPLEGDVSWSLGFKPLDGRAALSDDLGFLIKSPLQEPMIISHLSFITGASKDGKVNGDHSEGRAIRSVLIGFKCNTILGLYDLASRSFKHIWKFEGPPQASADDKEHFNLVHFDTQSSTLLVCNSLRSSIFAVPLEFQPLPALGNASLPALLEKGLLPWSIQLSYPIKEYALMDPCTSVSISAADHDGEPSRLFVAFPEGISVLRLLSPELPAESSATDVVPKPEPAKAESVPEPATRSVAVDDQAAPGKSSKKKNKKKKAARVQADEDPEKAVEAKVPSERNQTDVQPAVAQLVVADTPEVVQPSRPDVTRTPKDAAPVPTASMPHSSYREPAAIHERTTNTPVNVSADAIQSALSDTVTAAVHDAVSARIASGFQQTVKTAIPKEVERLISSTELKAELTRNIAQTILPAVQRTAMEVVSRVLAPHFEDVMLQVSERAERAIVSEITSVRKALVAEQSESLKDTEQTVKAIQGQVEQVLKQMRDLTAQPENKIVGLKDDPSRAQVKSGPAPRFGSADDTSDGETAVAVKSRNIPVPVPVHVDANANAHKDVGGVVRKDTALSPAQLPTKCRLPERVAIIGAGPVGCLAALAFAQRGCKVDIFESRPDPRTHEAVARASQRSINLALSTRGITGLRSVSLVGLGKNASTSMDLADLVLQESVPMRARMIHVVTKRATADKQAEVKEVSQLYSNKGESINSVDRGRLNNILLDHAMMHPSVAVHFEHKLQSVDFDHDTRGKVASATKTIQSGHAGGESSVDEASRRGKKPKRSGDAGTQLKSSAGAAVDLVRLDFDVYSTNQRMAKTSNTHYASFVVGCDGAHSSIRTAMGSLIRMHYTHNYIDTGYVELSIPPRTSLSSGSRIRGNGGVDGRPGGHDAFQLDPNHLHIWPRHSFMLIALPNLDGSFTSTLFAPFKIFASELSTAEGIVAFFAEHFPDALPLIGQDKLVECLTTRRASALGSVQCDPYHYKDRAVLIGDAAHAMLPFYGQGLNCGFEDVRVMFDIIDASATLEEALEQYTVQRHPDLKAILQLAEQNYREMAHSVVSWPYLLRKKLDGWLMAVLPSSMWSSLYAMTTFSNLPYSQVVRTEKRQQKIISNAVLTTALGICTSAMVGVYRTRQVWQPVTNAWIGGLQKKL